MHKSWIQSSSISRIVVTDLDAGLESDVGALLVGVVPQVERVSPRLLGVGPVAAELVHQL